jgi:hypothetical protein
MNHETDNPRGQPQQEWLDLHGLTQHAPVSDRTLRTWIHAPVDPLPAYRRGKKLFVRRRDFDEWLERHRVQPRGAVDVSAMVDEILADVCGRK